MTENYWGNKTFVVTGGARGQGAAEVNRLLALGSNVIVIDPLAPDSPDWAVDRTKGDRLRMVSGSVADEKTWSETLNGVQAFGAPLAGLVNNAGVTLRKTVTETALPEWENLLSINLTGAYLGIRAVASVMMDGGSIVNVSSTAGLTGYFSAAYTASKWGLRGLTKAAAIELAARKIRVNTVCPGLIDTPMINRPNGGYNLDQARAFFEGNRSMTPLARGADPDEVAGAVVFLLGPDSRFMTATDLVVDGGMIGGGIYCHIGRSVGTVQEAV
ncbi:SDR family NAD(P)-dependent oxidoreductase [Microvirga massiliensis]|uniref:SDR family NAD(P)-dependent oxidoreductase n=1 Tax=Microvirga massiliensis TaxID=1033741 RepID=UPI00062BF121|nr:SDR family oxidoreductase [Microvirga massiliensis]